MPLPTEPLPNVFYLQPTFMFSLLSFVNLLNFMDRGIIPGATNEFNTFIQDSMDTDTPDVYLGLLQSAFVIGFIMGSVIFGHMIHHYGRFFLTGVGLSIWSVAVVLSGFSYYSGSYVFLIFARMLSGFGEASLQCSVPPWIEATAPPGTKGTWLAIFYTAIPVGTAVGYAYSSLLAESIGWQFSFFIEAIFMVPCVVYLFSVSHHFPCEHEVPKALHRRSIEGEREVDTKRVLSVTQDPHEELVGRNPSVDSNIAPPPTVLEEFLAVCARPVFLCLTAGYAAQTGALIGLSTFGSAFIMGLGYFDSESEASTVFGVLVSIAGIFGTVLGGVILDRMMVKSAASKDTDDHLASVNGEGSAPLLPSEEGNDVTLLEPADGSAHKAELNSITQLIAVSSLIGVACLCCNYFVYNKGFYLTMVTFGCFFIFLCGSGINMGVMLAVPRRHRSFGIAIMAVCIHVFGDVPSPVIAGLLKDYLAPDCVPSATDADDGNIATSDACRDDNHGLRFCMLLICLWLLWTAFFFGLACFLNWRNRNTCSALTSCAVSCCGFKPEERGTFSAVSIHDDYGTDGVGGRTRLGGASRGSRMSINSTAPTVVTSPQTAGTGGAATAAEPYAVYARNKKNEQHQQQRSLSRDSGSSFGEESAAQRSKRLSGSLTKSASTEDLANIFKLSSVSGGSGTGVGGGGQGSGSASLSSSYSSASGMNTGKGNEKRSSKSSKKDKKGSGRSQSSDAATVNPTHSDTVMV